MGKLKELASSSLFSLQADTTVGRSVRCEVVVPSALVSTHHASIRWRRGSWELRDLGSTNGTFVNRKRMNWAEVRCLEKDDVIDFGSAENRYEVVDVREPELRVRAEDGTCVLADGPVLFLPSPDDPQVTLYRSALGDWHLESTGATTMLQENRRFHALGQWWEVITADGVTETLAVDMDVRQSRAHFTVSADEEHITIQLSKGGGTVSLGNFAWNYLLLTLARKRMEDAASLCAESEAGWVRLDELVRSFRTTAEHLNVDVCRARKRVAKDFENGAQIVERRQGTGQLRIGLRDISIEVGVGGT